MKWLEIHPSNFDKNGNLTDEAKYMFIIPTMISLESCVVIVLFIILAALVNDVWVRGFFVFVATSSGVLGGSSMYLVISVYKAWHSYAVKEV